MSPSGMWIPTSYEASKTVLSSNSTGSLEATTKQVTPGK
jgi:hypothetical protein